MGVMGGMGITGLRDGVLLMNGRFDKWLVTSMLSHERPINPFDQLLIYNFYF